MCIVCIFKAGEILTKWDAMVQSKGNAEFFDKKVFFQKHSLQNLDGILEDVSEAKPIVLW